MENVKQEIPVDAAMKPVKIEEEDHEALREVQVRVDALAKYRQEMGRLVQLSGNWLSPTNGATWRISTS